MVIETFPVKLSGDITINPKNTVITMGVPGTCTSSVIRAQTSRERRQHYLQRVPVQALVYLYLYQILYSNLY